MVKTNYEVKLTMVKLVVTKLTMRLKTNQEIKLTMITLTLV